MQTHSHRRDRPVYVVVSADRVAAEETAARLSRNGAVAYPAHGVEGCLRMATSIGPDVVVLDPALPGRLERLLRAHPVSANARIISLREAAEIQPDLSTILLPAA